MNLDLLDSSMDEADCFDTGEGIINAYEDGI